MRVETHAKRAVEHSNPRARIERRSAQTRLESRRERVAVFEETAHEHRLIAHVTLQRTQELAFEQARKFETSHRHQDDDGIDEQQSKS